MEHVEPAPVERHQQDELRVRAFWLDPTARLDLTNTVNRQKFTSLIAGNLDILTCGNGITGSIPQHFLVGSASQWNEGAGVNRGVGNKFVVTS